MAEVFESLRSGGLIKGSLRVTARLATNIPIDITGHTSQTADLFRIRNSAGTELMSLDKDGNLSIAGNMTVVDHDVADDFTVTDSLTVNGTATFNGDMALGDNITDTVTINATTVFNSPVRVNNLTSNNNLVANNLTVSGTFTGPGGASYLINVVEDTTPQLGGNLDVNGNGITFAGATVTDVSGADTILISGTAGTSGNLLMWNADGDAVDASVAASAILQNIVEDTTPQLGGALDGQGNDLNNLGVIFLTEQAEAEADVAGKGQIWVDTATPNVLMFTDDAGTDFTIANNATASLPSLGTVSTALTGVLRADSGVLSADSDVTDLVDNLAVSQLADGTDGELITWDAAGAPTTVGVGTSGQVLTSNGAGAAPTFQAAGGGSTHMVFNYDCGELYSNKYTSLVSGSGAVNASAGGFNLSTGTTDGSDAGFRATLNGANVTAFFDRSVEFGALIDQQGVGGDNNAFFGIMDFQAGYIPTTVSHMGFLFETSSGTTTPYVINGNGSQTKTALTGYTEDDNEIFYCKLDGTTDITFYLGDTLKNTSTTNLPTGTSDYVFVAMNNNTAGNTTDNDFNLGQVTVKVKIA